jgi:hypothetical protein
MDRYVDLVFANAEALPFRYLEWYLHLARLNMEAYCGGPARAEGPRLFARPADRVIHEYPAGPDKSVDELVPCPIIHAEELRIKGVRIKEDPVERR